MANMSAIRTVWVFTGPRALFPAGVFSTKELAEIWIRQHALSGTLTRYPLDDGAYDWATKGGFFTPSKPEHHSAAFIERFSAASQEHYHYESGLRD